LRISVLGRLVPDNSILLSALLERYKAADDQKAIRLLRKIPPVAWQHIHFLGRYLFRGNRHPIDVEVLLADVALWREPHRPNASKFSRV
jgi:hypothetical protein